MVSEKKNSYSFWQCVFDWGVSIMFPLFQFPILPVWLHKHAMRAFFVVEKHAWVLTIYMGKPEIPVWKLNGSRHSV